MLKTLIVLFALMYACVSQAASEPVELRVATAANFYPTLNKIKIIYEQLTNHKIKIIRGSTGKIYAQVMHGAPYDIFFSADSIRADKLIKKNKAHNNQSLVYAIGQLALWQPNVDSSQSIRDKLMTGQFNKLAIANPKTAPYGRASIQALKSMEIYEEVKNKLVFGENISQTLQFVQSGAAELGFVARSYVVEDIYWEIEPYQHAPIQQKVIILKQSKNVEVAQQFIEFIQSDAIQKIIVNDGYLL